jgi:hypothetical protein
MDCKVLSRYMTDERVGQSYPCHALKQVQIDNGLSWSHIIARRDANFEALKVLCDTHFAACLAHVAGVSASRFSGGVFTPPSKASGGAPKRQRCR